LPCFVLVQILSCCRLHPVPDFNLHQIIPFSRFHPHPYFTPPHISPFSRFQPAPHFTLTQISPFSRFHPALEFTFPDFTCLQISPFPSHHPTGFFRRQISGLFRFLCLADPGSHQSGRAPRFTLRANSAPAQIHYPRRFSPRTEVCAGPGG